MEAMPTFAPRQIVGERDAVGFGFDSGSMDESGFEEAGLVFPVVALVPISSVVVVVVVAVDVVVEMTIRTNRRNATRKRRSWKHSTNERSGIRCDRHRDCSLSCDYLCDFHCHGHGCGHGCTEYYRWKDDGVETSTEDEDRFHDQSSSTTTPPRSWIDSSVSKETPDVKIGRVLDSSIGFVNDHRGRDCPSAVAVAVAVAVAGSHSYL